MTKRTDTAIATVRDLAQQGATDATIAATLAVNVRTILRWRKHAGIPAGWAGPVRTAPCGTPSRYESGCHCQPCTDANNARWRAYTARKRAAAPAGPRSNQRWTADEDLVALDPSRTVVERAQALGRSYAAVTLRLQALRGTRGAPRNGARTDAEPASVSELGPTSERAAESIVSQAHYGRMDA